MHAIAERRDELDDFLYSIDEHAIDAVSQPIVDLRHGVADDGASAALACTMNKNTDRGDGTVGFHWASDQDREYITIRRRTEPLPAP
jgi:hypothetical protein